MLKNTYKIHALWSAVDKTKIKHPNGCFIESNALNLTDQQKEFLQTVEAALKEHELDGWPRPKIRKPIPNTSQHDT